jgi:hypothetical protein
MKVYKRLISVQFIQVKLQLSPTAHNVQKDIMLRRIIMNVNIKIIKVAHSIITKAVSYLIVTVTLVLSAKLTTSINHNTQNAAHL